MVAQMCRSYRIFMSVLGLVVAFSLGFTGCANWPTLLPTDTQLVSLATMPERASVESFAHGRAVAVTQCANCHRFYFPHEYAPSTWPSLVSDMGKRAQLTPRETRDVTRYMVAASKATRCESEPAAPTTSTPGTATESVMRGRSLAATRCAKCHRLYQPQEYAPNAWPQIIRSMAARSKLSEDEIRDISSYYTETAKQGW